jgi:hypothetical protein
VFAQRQSGGAANGIVEILEHLQEGRPAIGVSEGRQKPHSPPATFAIGSREKRARRAQAARLSGEGVANNLSLLVILSSDAPQEILDELPRPACQHQPQ